MLNFLVFFFHLHNSAHNLAIAHSSYSSPLSIHIPCQGWLKLSRLNPVLHSSLRDPLFPLYFTLHSLSLKKTMLLNTTSFLVSHIRTSISATVHSTNSLYTSFKSSLGLVNAASTTTSQNSPRDKDGISSSSSASSAAPWYDQEMEENQTPLGHEQYPSLQPWRGLSRRIKNYGYTAPVASTYTAPRYPIVLCHGM